MVESNYDEPVELAAGVFRLLAENPSAMTSRGTNSYVVGTTDFIAIDPGPEDERHTDALIQVTKGRLRYIVVTHAHRDHYPGAITLRDQTAATLLSYGPRADFVPDGQLADGDVITVPGARLRSVHTPGHSSDHLCYLLEKGGSESTPHYLFTGDHVLGGTTTAIIPPDGDMTKYLGSLDRLLSMIDEIDAFAPGHGDVITRPGVVLAQYREHRLEREASVIETLSLLGESDAAAITEVIYRRLSERLQRAARGTIWAHLQKLASDGVVRADDPLDIDAKWSLTSTGS